MTFLSDARHRWITDAEQLPRRITFPRFSEVRGCMWCGEPKRVYPWTSLTDRCAKCSR